MIYSHKSVCYQFAIQFKNNNIANFNFILITFIYISNIAGTEGWIHTKTSHTDTYRMIVFQN